MKIQKYNIDSQDNNVAPELMATVGHIQCVALLSRNQTL